MKKIKLMMFTLMAMFVSLVLVNAQSGMPSENPEGTITLSEDVTLTTVYEVTSGKTLTIDLNGHKITGPANNYAILNEGTLTIKDSGSTKGSIDCTGNDKNSCIVNRSSATIDGVTVMSAFVALKNESNGTMDVKNNSYITSSVDNKKLEEGNTSTIFNYGTITIADSKVEATGNQGVAVMGLTYEGSDSSITITGTEIDSVYAGVDAIDGAKVTVKDTVFDVNGSALLTNKGSSISVEDSEFKNGSIMVKQSGITLSGEIKTKYLTSISYATSGARVTLTESATITDDSITVPEDVTLVIPDNVEVSVSTKKNGKSTSHGTLTVKGEVEGNLDAVAYNEDTGVYYGSLERAVEDADAGETIDVLKDTEETYSYSSFDDRWQLVGNNDSAIENLADDVTINLNGHNVKANLNNPDGNTLTIADEKGNGTLDGNITNEGTLEIETGNKELVKNSDGSYSLVYSDADYSKLNGALDVAKGLDTSKYTDESLKALYEAINAAENVAKNLKADEQDKINALANALTTAIANLVSKDGSSVTPNDKPVVDPQQKPEEESPNTYDAGLVYMGLALGAIGVSAISVRKLRNN